MGRTGSSAWRRGALLERVLLGGTVLAALTFTASLLLDLPGLSGDLRDVVLGNLVYALPTATLLVRAVRDRHRRRWLALLAAGAGSFLVGNVVYLELGSQGPVPFPSWADAGYLGIYPLLLAGILAAVRGRLQDIRLGVTLDGLLGATAAGAAGAWLTDDLVHALAGRDLAAAVGLAYPVCDLLLASTALGAAAMVGRRAGRSLAVVATGTLVLAAADTIYAHRLATDTYVVGTGLDALWAVGFALIAVGASIERADDEIRVPGSGSLVVPGVGTATAVAVLAFAPTWTAYPVPRVLALVCLLLCSARLVMTFSQVRGFALLRTQAMTDELTGIANRRRLVHELDQRLDGAPRGARGVTALVVIDLDRFKEVNDSFGHAVGDQLLRHVASRFDAALAAVAPHALLARLGGDEFAVAADVEDVQEARRIADALAGSLAEPVPMDDLALHVRASIGLAVSPDHGRTRSDLLYAADAAMYVGKTADRPVNVYSPRIGGDRRLRRQLAEDLHRALEGDELFVAYQPIYDAAGELRVLEALVRWQHPVRGVLLPGEFVPVAESHRMTMALATRVLDLALRDLARLRAQGHRLMVAVNVSAADLSDASLVSVVRDTLDRYGVEPAALGIEVTETAMMADPDRALETFGELRKLGVQLAVDDYGVGQSGLEYLLRLPAQVIKLDRVFVARMRDDSRAREIVRSTVHLSHGLGLQIVAEGVEDAVTLAMLLDFGCDLVQGWHLGRPQPVAEVERRLAAEAGTGSWPASAAG